PGTPPLPSQASTLPDSEFTINCRCGLSANGNLSYNVLQEGEAIQCNTFRDWSHIACQKNGRADRLGEKESFLCDFCDLFNGNIIPGEMEIRTMSKKPLKDRLRRGRGALARSGSFWYPVRLIHCEGDSWRVRWWRGCESSGTHIVPDSVTSVQLEDIVDSLWTDYKARREIRLGKWKRSCDVKTPDEILDDPSSIDYTKVVDDALKDSIYLLKQLLHNPEDVDSQLVPSKKWIESQRKSIRTTIVPYVGSLTLLERAQIANWFEIFVSEDPKIRHQWLALLPIAHAHTLFIAHRLQSNREDIMPDTPALTPELLKQAWMVQFEGTPSVLMDVDVERDCLKVLEEEMFEYSLRAGRAGNCQWGLDAGGHEDAWNPYIGLPEEWNYKDRVADAAELE
ncbi:hypothetical protein CPC08DRAFT_591108, partial [Agrocybe pediades]